MTPVRGAGQPQGVFAMERLLDRAAQALGIDRAEIRRRNLIPAERMPCPRPLKTRGNIAAVLDSGDYLRCQEDALARIGRRDFPVRQVEAVLYRHRAIPIAPNPTPRTVTPLRDCNRMQDLS